MGQILVRHARCKTRDATCVYALSYALRAYKRVCVLICVLGNKLEINSELCGSTGKFWEPSLRMR